MRIEPGRGFQKIVEIVILVGFLTGLWPTFFFKMKNTLFSSKSFSAPMFDFVLYVCMIHLWKSLRGPRQ